MIPWIACIKEPGERAAGGDREYVDARFCPSPSTGEGWGGGERGSAASPPHPGPLPRGERGTTEPTSTSVTPIWWGNPHSIRKDLTRKTPLPSGENAFLTHELVDRI